MTDHVDFNPSATCARCGKRVRWAIDGARSRQCVGLFYCVRARDAAARVDLIGRDLPGRTPNRSAAAYRPVHGGYPGTVR
jgi:hypothetical protein